MSGFLAHGAWRSGWYDTGITAGEFVRPAAGFRDRLPRGAFRAAPGRYHLYVSLAGPWAHRTLIMRALKGLEAALPVSVTELVMDEGGWAFSAERPDHANGFRHLHEAYTASRRRYERMAEEVAAGVRDAGSQAVIKRVPATVPADIARKSGFTFHIRTRLRALRHRSAVNPRAAKRTLRLKSGRRRPATPRESAPTAPQRRKVSARSWKRSSRPRSASLPIA